MPGWWQDGHIGHIVGLGQKLEKEPPGKLDVWLLFQPAEETGKGAEKMIDNSFFQELKIERMIALHNLPGFEENEILIREGVFAAASTVIKVIITGSSSIEDSP